MPIELTLSPALAFSGIALEGRSTMVWDGSTYTRDVDTARAVIDFPSAGSRLIAGTVDNKPVSFQGGASLIGVSFARESGFPGSDPRVRRDSEDIELNRPATVSVAVNGTAIRTVTLPPGNYHASDLLLRRDSTTLRYASRNRACPRAKSGSAYRSIPRSLVPGKPITPSRSEWIEHRCRVPSARYGFRSAYRAILRSGLI
jgi:hypothetical protein